MKTDKQAAEDYAKENWGKLEGSTIEIMQQSFEAGCKHKDESRWIPVSAGLPRKSGCFWVVNGYNHVHKVFYDALAERWHETIQEQERDYEYEVFYYQPYIIPPPPQTNK